MSSWASRYSGTPGESRVEHKRESNKDDNEGVVTEMNGFSKRLSGPVIGTFLLSGGRAVTKLVCDEQTPDTCNLQSLVLTSTSPDLHLAYSAFRRTRHLLSSWIPILVLPMVTEIKSPLQTHKKRVSTQLSNMLNRRVARKCRRRLFRSAIPLHLLLRTTRPSHRSPRTWFPRLYLQTLSTPMKTNSTTAGTTT